MKQRQKNKLIKKHGAEWFKRYESEMKIGKRLGFKPRHRNGEMSGIALMHRYRNRNSPPSAMSKVWG